MHGWAFYDLECRQCGSHGLVGLWVEIQMASEIWNGEWQGFLGVVDRKDGLVPGSLRCTTCQSAEVIAVMRGDDSTVMACHDATMPA